MRGGKKGSHKGRERVLAENEDDIIARNMMVGANQDVEGRRERRRRSAARKSPRRVATNRSRASPMPMSPIPSLRFPRSGDVYPVPERIKSRLLQGNRSLLSKRTI